MLHHPRHKDSCETDNRLDWWLREFGRYPTRRQLLRIRAYRRAEKRLRSLAAPCAEARGAAGTREPAAPVRGAR